MGRPYTIEVVENAFDPNASLAAFSAKNSHAGAVVSFLGQVRNDDQEVDALELEHYPGYTEKQIEEIARAAMERWRLDDLFIVHRTGRMVPGDAIVLVAAASTHRRDAFEATDFVMDFLKSDAPFWKREVRGRNSQWIEPREQDYQDIARWRYNGETR